MAKDYKQGWYPNYPYAAETIAAAGCGPTSVADLLEIEPPEIADWMTKHGYAYPYQGTAYAGINAALTAYGADGKMIAQGQDGQTECQAFRTWRTAIQDGQMGILLMHGTKNGCKDNYWTFGGHYIAVVSYSDGYYLVYDPASATRTGWHPFSDFAGDIAALYTSTLRWNDTKIAIDGWWGKGTTRKLQQVLSAPLVDGIVSNQSRSMQKYLTHCISPSWEFVKPEAVKQGSSVIRLLQKKIGASADGVVGLKTIKALQKFLSVEQDGYFGDKSVRALQSWLNKQ